MDEHLASVSGILEKMLAFSQGNIHDIFLVGHHHTFSGIDSPDRQILVEADYIANASENGYSAQNVSNFIRSVMKTESGIRLAQTVFCL